METSKAQGAGQSSQSCRNRNGYSHPELRPRIQASLRAPIREKSRALQVPMAATIANPLADRLCVLLFHRKAQPGQYPARLRSWEAEPGAAVSTSFQSPLPMRPFLASTSAPSVNRSATTTFVKIAPCLCTRRRVGVAAPRSNDRPRRGYRAKKTQAADQSQIARSASRSLLWPDQQRQHPPIRRSAPAAGSCGGCPAAE